MSTGNPGRLSHTGSKRQSRCIPQDTRRSPFLRMMPSGIACEATLHERIVSFLLMRVYLWQIIAE